MVVAAEGPAADGAVEVVGRNRVLEPGVVVSLEAVDSWVYQVI